MYPAFQSRFVEEHARFARAVTGLPGTAARHTYAAMVLQRLVFLYFLEAHGLPGHAPSLRTTLDRHHSSPGGPSFYRGFLAQLFRDGWKGTILRRGLFLPPEAEADGVDIADVAFQRVFAFFDNFRWCLQEREPTGDVVTPAMLGTLFEKHVQRKNSGSYYTGADVTAYIVRNTLVPGLLDQTRTRCPKAFLPAGPVWGLLRGNPLRYLHPAVWHVHTLPTETQAERQARQRRELELHDRLRAGTVHEVDDLITLNLDGQRFLLDLIGSAEAELRAALQQAVEEITVLDPTCGSGAFLFAALDLLEELLRACAGTGGHQPALCGDIITRNLFGVDLRAEAVELCRLRFLLRVAASATHGDKLPDLAGNLRVGNALIGAASLPEVRPGSKRGAEFHWPLEFPGPMGAGGFAVIVGNPPYIPAQQVRRDWAVGNYRTAACPDAYAWVLERTAQLVRPGGRCGMVVPLSLGFSAAFAPCRDLLFSTYGDNWFASFGRIPSALFAGDIRVRNIIHLGHKSGQVGSQHTTRLHRWFDAARPLLFQTLEYAPFVPRAWAGRIPKLNTAHLARAMEDRLLQTSARLGDSFARKPTPHVLYFKKTAYNWLNFCRRLPPCFAADGSPLPHTQFDTLYFPDSFRRDLALLLLNGKWAYAFWCILGDDFHVTRWTFDNFPIDLAAVPDEMTRQLRPLARRLDAAMGRAVSFKQNAGKRVGNYNLARCRHITDQSDRRFGEYLGLTECWPDVELLYQQVVKTTFAEA